MLRIARKVNRKQLRLILYNTPESYGPARWSHKDVCPPPKKKSTTGTVYTLGALALVGGATIGYAKYDPDFRRTLVEYVPFTDTVIRVVFQEESTLDYLNSLYQDAKKSIVDTIGGDKRGAEITPPSKIKPYKAPSPVLTDIDKDQKKNKPEEPYAEIRMEKKDEEPKIVTESKSKIDEEKKSSELEPNNLVELEKKICEAATDAVNAYNKAIYELKVFNRDIALIVDNSVDRIKSETWDNIRAKAKKKNEALKQAECRAEEATANLKRLKELVARPDFEASDVTKEMVKLNISKVEGDIANAKRDYGAEQRMGSASEKYWDKVEKARKHFQEELESLFPTINLNSKKLSVPEEDLDLFLLHVYATVLFYQKELAKAETVAHERLQAATEAARKGGGEVLTNAQICEALEEERRRLSICFQKQVLKLKQEAEHELREQLKRQTQAFNDHLDEHVKTCVSEVQMQLARKFDEELEAERCKFKIQLATMTARLQGLQKALKIRDDADKMAKQSQVLWSACQALIRALRMGCPGFSWQDQLRPLNTEIDAIRKAAAESDELVNAVIAGIPKQARDRGVFPEDALRERFLKVEEVARSVALVPAEGGALPLYFLSFVQSLLLFKNTNPIPQAELHNEVVDFSKLNTNEILQRARYWLDRGDFEQTLKYMNLLKGAARSLARQWMEETRIFLETQQAANTLMAHASSSGLMYL